ncbi:hypothetical protein ACET3Z_030996 [Daucus carota]
MDKLSKDNRYLVDVVGTVKNVRCIKSNKNESEKMLTKFDLSDGRCVVAVTLFDDFGVQFQETLTCCKEPEVYVILCAAKVTIYEGMPNLTNYPATRYYINPGHYSLQQITQRLFAMKTEPVESPPPQEMNYETMIVKEIQSLASDTKEMKVKCHVKVTKVEVDTAWYYAACTKCPNEIQRSEGVFKCLDYNRIIPYPDKRFRVCTLCSDTTGSIAVIFLDEEVSRIIDKTVFDLEAEAIQDKTQDKFPKVLKQFENKLYNITLKVTDNNLKKGSRVYEADEIVDKIESGASFDPSAKIDSEMRDESAINLADDNTNTPHTAKSSTKTRPRVDIETVTFDPKEELLDKGGHTEKKKKMGEGFN